MKFRITIILIITGAIGVFGFNWVKNFIEVDICLDRGGSWNYATNTCEFSDPVQGTSLRGSVWISESQLGGIDSLIFTSESEVTYYLEEVTWDFRSTYEIEGNVVTILTKTYELEVEDPGKYDPNLKQRYKISENRLELVYQAFDRNRGWEEDSIEQLSQIEDFKRIK